MSGATTQFGRVPYAIINGGAIADVKPAAMKVYLVLLAHADEDWTARVGMRRIGALTGTLTSSVSRSVAQLKTAGLIDTAEAINGQPYTYKIITVMPDKRSPASERSAARSVRPPANGSNPDRSPAGAPTVRPAAQNRSPTGEQNRGTEKRTDRARAAHASGGGSVRRRDEVFEAVAEVCGLPLDQLTASARGTLNRAAKELRDLHATPADVRRRADAYRATYPGATLTPSALAKHWPALTPGNRRDPDRVTTADLDRVCPHVEPSEDDWAFLIAPDPTEARHE